MYRSYFKIGWRNLLRDKSHTFINVSGLAIGMAVAILLGLWIFDELNYNKSFINYSRLASVYHNIQFGADLIAHDGVPAHYGQELKNNYPEFEAVATTLWPQEYELTYEETDLSGTGLFVEAEFINLFSIRLIEGTALGLQEIHTVMLSQSLANDLIGENAIGKLIKFNNHDFVKVVGLFEDFPHNSQFGAVKMLLPLAYHFSMNESNRNQESNWEDYSFQCFVLLNQQATYVQAETKMKNLLHEKASNDGKALHPAGHLFPMEKWHLYAQLEDGKISTGTIQQVWMMATVGLLVLLLACINFTTLSTARSEKRFKEVGVRKVMGSARNQLVYQFLMEAFLIVVFAFAISLTFACLCLPSFNELAGKQLNIPFSNSSFLLLSISFILITSLLAGSYPALYFSSFNPVNALKGNFKSGRFAGYPRKVMVVFQFTISIILIPGTLVVYLQIQHAKNRPTGFDREGIIHLGIHTENLAKANYNSLRHDLLSTGVVENMAISDFPITGSMSGDASLTWEGKDPSTQPLIAMNQCSHDFPKTNGFQFVAGRDFSRDFSTDSTAVIINEMGARLISNESVLGKKIRFGYGVEREIIGVIKDQIRWTPFTKQSPHIYYVNYTGAGYLTIRFIHGVPIQDALQKTEAVIKQHAPSAPFNYKFQDEDYARLFNDEERVGRLASIFSALAIFISCIGMFGLASFAASKRTKEIGIRKILGASVFKVWILLSRDFTFLVILSVVLALPIAYYFSNRWLQQYEYRVNIAWWIFVVTGFGALIIVLLTVSYQSIKAARANPVDSLRSE